MVMCSWPSPFFLSSVVTSCIGGADYAERFQSYFRSDGFFAPSLGMAAVDPVYRVIDVYLRLLQA
jgi:hypothetical protein